MENTKGFSERERSLALKEEILVYQEKGILTSGKLLGKLVSPEEMSVPCDISGLFTGHSIVPWRALESLLMSPVLYINCP